MEQTALLLISLTLVLLALIIGLLAFLVFKLLNQKTYAEPATAYESTHPEIQHRLKEIDAIKKKKPELFCVNHPDDPSEIMCSICDRLFCKTCVKPFKTMYFCKEHLPLVMQNEWDEVLTLKTSSEKPDEGVHLFEIKKDIFERENIPTYVETHYKINVDHDFIETYLVVFGIKGDIQQTLLKFSGKID